MKNTYLSFIVGNELYAVNVSKVLEVLEKQTISRVPNAPQYIKGIINFRGDIVPVFETRDKFNLPTRIESDACVIIVLDLSQNTEIFRIGAMVDKVKDVLEIDDSEIKPVPTMSKEFNTQFLKGIYKLSNNFILLLDVEKVFTTEEMDALSKTIEE
ncbi:MAG TPA: chemotaxis protein CheW [Bacteroidales bacterium]|nr:chemotaxis protein CheW [Bacteroidales bacterium]